MQISAFSPKETPVDTRAGLRDVRRKTLSARSVYSMRPSSAQIVLEDSGVDAAMY